MKLVLCNKYYFARGGSERYLSNVERLLAGAGHVPIPFAVAFPGTEPSPYSSYFAPAPTRGGGPHIRSMRPTLVETARMGLNAAYSLPAKRALARLIRDHRPQAGYLFNIVNYLSPSLVDAFKEAGLPVVMFLSDFTFCCAKHTFFREGRICFECKRGRWHGVAHRCVHGSLPASLARASSMWVHERLGLYKKVDHYVAPSRRMIEELVEFGVPRAKTSYLPTPVAAGEFRPREEHEHYFLFVGRVSQEKGLEVLLKAFRRVAGRGFRLRLVAGSDEDFARTLAADLAQPGVDLLGPRYGAELAAQYAGACAVVVPSLCHDNSPNVVAEAMASGKPVIGSRVGGIPDQIDDACGLLVEPGDVTALAAAMERIMDDEPARAAMGRAARRRAETYFGEQQHLDGLLDVFARLGVSIAP